MAIKKSELYSSLWASCDELRGGMDASQYKDYVLFMLFIKYISDKYANSDDYAPPVTIPKGASFSDMLALRSQDDIGDKINTQIIQQLINANTKLARSDFPDFNDPNKLGEGSALVERLTNLINIFNSPALDFSKNRADHDDILGDAYEYLMRHFAQDSGKSKGQFYTPSEVSRKVLLDHKRINLYVRPGSSHEKRTEVMHEWHKSLLHEFVPGIIEKWQPKLGVKVQRYFLQKMKTKWGSCNNRSKNIRVNTELVKKPKDLIEYVIVHEMVHLLEPTHSERFVSLLTKHYPTWREARKELNELPLVAEQWVSHH